MVLEILCVEPIYPQYSGVLETCLALRYCFFEVLGSESVKQLLKTEMTWSQPIIVRECIFKNQNLFFASR